MDEIIVSNRRRITDKTRRTFKENKTKMLGKKIASEYLTSTAQMFSNRRAGNLLFRDVPHVVLWKKIILVSADYER